MKVAELRMGNEATRVMPVDKLLSGVFTVGLAYLVFNETASRRAAIALCLVGLGSAVIML